MKISLKTLNSASGHLKDKGSGAFWKRMPSAVFAVWALWLSLPFFLLGSSSTFPIHDNADQMLSALVGYSRGVASPTVWAAGWASGVDWLSQAYTNNLYTLLFLFLPAWVAYSLLMIVQRFLAGYFSYRLLRERDVEETACLYAGLAYSLMLQPTGSFGFGLYRGLTDAAFPFVLWIITRKANSRRSLYIFAFIVGIVYALSSSFHLSVFIFVLIPMWLWISGEVGERKRWITSVLFFAGWLLASAPAIAAAALNAAGSHRAAWNPRTVGRLRVALEESGELLWFNIVNWGLVVLSLCFKKARSHRVVRVSLAALACATAPLVWFALDTKLHRFLGFLSGFTWSRVYLAVPFLTISAGAMAGSVLLRAHTGSKRFGYIILGAIVFVAGQSLRMNTAFFHSLVEGSNYRDIYANPDVLALSATLRSGKQPYRVASVGIHPAFMWGYGLETADGYLNLYPRRYQQFWSAVVQKSLLQDDTLRSYFEDYFGSRIYLYVPGENPTAQVFLLPKQVATTIKFADLFNLDLLSLANVKYVISTVPLDDPSLMLLPSSVREQQIEWWRKSKFSRYMDVVRHRSLGIPLYIYENHKVLPRFFCAKQVVPQTPTEVLSDLRSFRSQDFLSEMLVRGSAFPNNVTDTVASLDVEHYSNDCITLKVTSSAGCPLVIANNYNRYWSARVDDKDAEVLLVDQTFQGIEVPSGEHRVEMEYHPPYMPLGCR